MRLIDADAEIARIEQEIQRIDEKIERLKKLVTEEPFNTFHKFEKELEQCCKNKTDCKTEIATLKNYQTAYDVEKVIEELQYPNNYTIVAGKHFTLVDRSVDIVKDGLTAKTIKQDAGGGE